MLSIFKDIALALHYLHKFREPLIHRDLTPPNVLLKTIADNKYIAKVSDFGSSNLAKDAITAGEGAIIYTAPESFPVAPNQPQPKQTVKIDSYSFGILLCEVVNCQMLNTDNRNAMLEAMAARWRDAHRLSMMCVKQDPANRPAMTEILHYLSWNV